MDMNLAGLWQQARPLVKRALIHRDRGSEIAEKAVMTGAVVAVGIGTMLAFMNGLGTFFTTLIARIIAWCRRARVFESWATDGVSNARRIAISRRAAFARTAHGRTHGQAMAEFAVTSVVFLFTVVGVVDLALWLHAQNVVISASQEAATVGSRGDRKPAPGCAGWLESVASRLGSGAGGIDTSTSRSGPIAPRPKCVAPGTWRHSGPSCLFRFTPRRRCFASSFGQEVADGQTAGTGERGAGAGDARSRDARRGTG